MPLHNVTLEVFLITTLTLGLAAVIDGRGVNACIVCDTPAASINSSLSSVLVLPRASGFFWWENSKMFLVQKTLKNYFYLMTSKIKQQLDLFQAIVSPIVS